MLVKTFNDGSYVEYTQGNFDKWCIYFTTNGNKIRPLDIHYFQRLQDLSKTHDNNKLYNDFVKIYDKTSNTISQDVLDYIDNISNEYNDDNLLVNQIFTILYMGMIAEENKKNSILGKRIKRLGVYGVLITKCDINTAANSMRGVNWKVIDRWCKELGF